MSEQIASNKGRRSVWRGRTLLTDKLTQNVQAAILEGYRKEGKTAFFEKTRVLPSTITDLGDGRYQIMANSFVSVSTSTEPQAKRPEVVNSVLTFEAVPGGRVLKTVKVPVFERNRSANSEGPALSAR